jgi:hypothetical protein
VPFQFTWFLNLTFNFLGFSRFSLSPHSKIAYKCHVRNFTMLHTTHAYVSVLVFFTLNSRLLMWRPPTLGWLVWPHQINGVGRMSHPLVGGSLMSQPLCSGWSCEHPFRWGWLCKPPLLLGAAKQAVPSVGGGCGIHHFTSG